MRKTEFLISLAKEALNKSMTSKCYVDANNKINNTRKKETFNGLVNRVKAADVLADYG